MHPLAGAAAPVTPVKYESPKPTINATKLMRDWRVHTRPEEIRALAKALGVDWNALESLGVAYAPEHHAWAFPMKDQYQNVVGIRLRNNAGRKWAVTGSRAGLIYSEPPHGLACICEGPTDCAAALSLGLPAIGRPSCLGQEDMILDLLKTASRVLLIVDNDDPGWNGAVKLQERLKVPSLCWSPPCKDVREFLNLGGTAAQLNALTKNLVWTQPRK